MNDATQSGSALTLVIAGIVVLSLLSFGGYETARRAQLAARSAADAAAALHGADDALGLYAAGRVSVTGSSVAIAAPASVDVTASPLARLPDGSILVLVLAASRAPTGLSSTARRTVHRVFRVDTLGVRTERAGTWRERI